MATPGITLTCTLHDINGNPVNKGVVTIVLFGFGPNLPSIVGTSMLAKVGPVQYSLADGTFDSGLKLWGNDQITPLNQTYYCITIEDDKKNIVQSGIYQFSGTQTIDLSNAPQINPILGTPPLQFVTADIWIILPGSSSQVLTPMGELVTQLEKVNTETPMRRPKPYPGQDRLLPTFRSFASPPGNTYTLSRTPWNAQLIGLWYNGLLLLPTASYTLVGRTITLTFSTGLGDNLYASYVASTVS